MGRTFRTQLKGIFSNNRTSRQYSYSPKIQSFLNGGSHISKVANNVREFGYNAKVAIFDLNDQIKNEVSNTVSALANRYSYDHVAGVVQNLTSSVFSTDIASNIYGLASQAMGSLDVSQYTGMVQSALGAAPELLSTAMSTAQSISGMLGGGTGTGAATNTGAETGTTGAGGTGSQAGSEYQGEYQGEYSGEGGSGSKGSAEGSGAGGSGASGGGTGTSGGSAEGESVAASGNTGGTTVTDFANNSATGGSTEGTDQSKIAVNSNTDTTTKDSNADNQAESTEKAKEAANSKTDTTDKTSTTDTKTTETPKSTTTDKPVENAGMDQTVVDSLCNTLLENKDKYVISKKPIPNSMIVRFNEDGALDNYMAKVDKINDDGTFTVSEIVGRESNGTYITKTKTYNIADFTDTYYTFYTTK